jgi:hypothetical protein
MEAFTRNALLTRAAAAAGCALAPGVFPSKTRAAPAWPSASAYTAEVPSAGSSLRSSWSVQRDSRVSEPAEAVAPECRSLAGQLNELGRPPGPADGAPLADGREPGACLHPAEPVPDCGGGERGGD